MNLVAAIERMEAARMDPANILLAVKCMAAEMEAPLERRRSADRERQARHRQRNVNNVSNVTECDNPSPLVPPLSPAPLSPPIIPPPHSRAPDGFDEIWEGYPRKVSKGAARKAYKSAILKTSPETIKASVRAFASKMAGTEDRFIPHFSKWLNDERWQDADLLAHTRAMNTLGPMLKRVPVFEGSPAWKARKAAGERFPTTDIKDDAGRIIGRGWYFETEYPQEAAA
jgi:hypothetical protein